MGRQKSFIEDQGWRLVLVHPGRDGLSLPDVGAAGLGEVDQIGDPHCELYRSFGLGKGSLRQLFRPRVLLAAIKSLIAGHRGGGLHGDALQLSGTFLLKAQKVVKSHTARDAADIGRLEIFAEK